MSSRSQSGSTTRLWVKSPDRLGMSTMDVLGIVQDLAARGAGVEFIDAPALSATTSQGEFMLIILAAEAQLERSMIRERQAEGIVLAKVRGVYVKGPTPIGCAELSTGCAVSAGLACRFRRFR